MKSNDRETIFVSVYELVSQIPRGKVVTYGDIARAVGVGPRYVGYILHNNPYPGEVPCHRVVSASGKAAANFAFGGGQAQQKLLEKEGIVFKDGKLKMNDYNLAGF